MSGGGRGRRLWHKMADLIDKSANVHYVECKSLPTLLSGRGVTVAARDLTSA